MRFLVPVVLAAAVGMAVVSPAVARKAVVVGHSNGHSNAGQKNGNPHRVKAKVYPGWPVRRATPTVIVRPARVAVVIAPRHYTAPITFSAVVFTWGAVTVSVPVSRPWVWEDAAVLSKEDDWTEFSLYSNCRGRAVVVAIEGKVQVEWAEVVFANGDAQVVDFGQRTHSSGTYQLMDFKSSRLVDHVRMVARAKSNDARVVLRMVK